MKKPVFFLVTGADFRRSMDWAKTWVNPVRVAIQKRIEGLKNK